jgi:anti-sigma B factor antagonist
MNAGIAPPQEVCDAWVVTAVGEIDIASAPLLRQQLDAALRSSPPWPVLVDLTGVTFLDSTGLGALVEAHQQATALGRELLLVGAHRSVRRVLELTRLDRLFEVHPDLESASSTRRPAHTS